MKLSGRLGDCFETLFKSADARRSAQYDAEIAKIKLSFLFHQETSGKSYWCQNDGQDLWIKKWSMAAAETRAS